VVFPAGGVFTDDLPVKTPQKTIIIFVEVRVFYGANYPIVDNAQGVSIFVR
jgi:hypothetical protein